VIDLEVKTITHHDCREWLLYKHYAKRLPPIQYAFGLFDAQKLVGICTYATPVSNTLRNLFDDFKLMELNRLVTNDDLPKNSTSFFVSKTLQMIPKPMVVVSYADTSQNHHGYIYQATNFIYTGLSAKFKEPMVRGLEKMHSASIYDISKGQKNNFEWLRNHFGENFYMRDRPQKHRYFYFAANKRDKKRMIKLLKYKIEAYPKGENKNYDASYNPSTQIQLF
jgi:hypothetical protein